MIGQTLSHYRITGALGAGGMGEVYRATDTSLGREVAIKVLPQEVAQDEERLARFRREAHLLAALNHPNVAAIYGLEEADGQPFLVLELVEGEDLAARLKRGAIPVDEALEIARQIAEGLEAAHEEGIVHRDLKPANVKLSPDGRVKVLDFGLAKAWAGGPVTGSSGDMSQSPTLAHTGTRAGVILGTAAYMSPEQARGKAVDKRTDIWAFGAVVFETLTGRQLFSGETVSDTLAAVLTREVDWTALPSDTPAGVRLLLRRCLDRNSGTRLRDIGEARIAVRPGETHPIPGAEVPERSRGRGITPWIAALVALLAALVGAAVGRGVRSTGGVDPLPLVRFALDTERPLLSSSWHQFGGLAISRDGQRLIYVASDGTVERLYERTMDSLVARPLPGTEGASNPFFSPDGTWIGFFADRTLKKISVQGGAPVDLALARDNRSGCWSDDDEIIFTPNASSGLVRIPAEGGEATPLTTPDLEQGEMSHRWPRLVAGADVVLFTVKTTGLQTFDDALIGAVSLRSGEQKIVLEGGTGASYSATGHILYARAGSLLAAPFDLERLAVTGPPFTAVEGVSRAMSTGSAHYGLSRGGTLVYLPASVDLENRTLVRMNPKGQIETLTEETGPYLTVRTSPDGRRLALWLGTANDEIWTYEIDRGTLARLTPEGIMPIWSPDGEWVIFQGAAPDDLFRVRADGSGPPEVLLSRPLTTEVPSSVSPDGRLLAYAEDASETGWDIWTLSLETREPRLVLGTRSNERAPVFSPDGRLLAYVSDESGRNEVYVQIFPGPGARRQVSAGGGTSPAWHPQGDQIFYQNDTEMMAVSVRAETGLQLARPRKVFDGVVPLTTDQVMAPWDLAPGGQGFVMPDQPEQIQASTLMLALNWGPDRARKATPGQ